MKRTADAFDADSDLRSAIEAAKAAPHDQEIAGLGPSVAPLWIQVPAALPPPLQYTVLPEPPLFTYFAIRGLGEVPRLMLAEAGAAYSHLVVLGGEDQKLAGNWRTWSPDGLLPTLSGCGVPLHTPLSQSRVIIRFLAKQLGMVGSSDYEAAMADVMFETSKDLLAEREQLFSGSRDETAAKGPWALARRIEALLLNSPNAAQLDAALHFGQLQLLHALLQLEERKPGTTAALSQPLEDFRASAAGRPRITAYLQSSVRFPATHGELGQQGGYTYTTGPLLRSNLMKFD